MNHDITHCQGVIGKLPEDKLSSKLDMHVCPRRETCYRYLMYLDAIKCKLQQISVNLPEEVPCHLYWESYEMD